MLVGALLLVRGRYPRDVFALVVGINRWGAAAYSGLLRDEYPPSPAYDPGAGSSHAASRTPHDLLADIGTAVLRWLAGRGPQASARSGRLGNPPQHERGRSRKSPGAAGETLRARAQPTRRRRSQRAPFPRILCAVDERESSAAAVKQAIALAGRDSRVMFAAAWYGKGSLERAATSDELARDAVESAVELARAAGVQASAQYFHVPRLGDALLSTTAWHDLVVVGGHPHARATGIVLGEMATQLVHRCAIPVLVARERPLHAGIIAATRAFPGDRAALTAATHLAARVDANLTVLQVPERHAEEHRDELRAELANAKALLGRGIDYLEQHGPSARGSSPSPRRTEPGWWFSAATASQAPGGDPLDR